MTELPAFHAWTHRPKAQGGTDPIEAAASPILFAGRSTSSGTTVTTPWELEAIPTMSANMGTNDADNTVFEEIQDSNGVNGVRVIQEGLYLFTASLGVVFPGPGATRLLPKFLRVDIGIRSSGSSAFGWSNSAFSNKVVWSDNPYLPEESDLGELSSAEGYTLYLREVFSLRDLGSGPQNVPSDYFMRLLSWGGVEDWQYTSSFWIYRMSDALPFVFQ